MSSTNSAVDNCYVFLHLVAGHCQLSLPLKELCGEVGRAVVQLDPLDHLHQGKVFVQFPNPVAAQKSLLPVEGAGDESILCRKPDQTGVAKGMAAEEQSGNFVPMKLKGILTDAALQNRGLARPAKPAGGGGRGGGCTLSHLPCNGTWHQSAQLLHHDGGD